MKIKEYFQRLVKAGTIPQEPMNYDAATLKIYIDHLEAENAALRERLEKAVEHGKYFIIEEPRNGKIYYSILRHKVINNYICTELTRAEAESRLAELKGGKE